MASRRRDGEVPPACVGGGGDLPRLEDITALDMEVQKIFREMEEKINQMRIATKCVSAASQEARVSPAINTQDIINPVISTTIASFPELDTNTNEKPRTRIQSTYDFMKEREKERAIARQKMRQQSDVLRVRRVSSREVALKSLVDELEVAQPSSSRRSYYDSQNDIKIKIYEYKFDSESERGLKKSDVNNNGVSVKEEAPYEGSVFSIDSNNSYDETHYDIASLVDSSQSFNDGSVSCSSVTGGYYEFPRTPATPGLTARIPDQLKRDPSWRKSGETLLSNYSPHNDPKQRKWRKNNLSKSIEDFKNAYFDEDGDDHFTRPRTLSADRSTFRRSFRRAQKDPIVEKYKDYFTSRFTDNPILRDTEQPDPQTPFSGVQRIREPPLYDDRYSKFYSESNDSSRSYPAEHDEGNERVLKYQTPPRRRYGRVSCRTRKD